MSQQDILGALLHSNPNLPAKNGTVLLLREEMKSEFQLQRLEIGKLTQRMEKMESGLDLVARSLVFVSSDSAFFFSLGKIFK